MDTSKFTSESQAELDKLIVKLTWENVKVAIAVGQTSNIFELVNSTSLQTLKKCLENIASQKSKTAASKNLYQEFDSSSEESTEVTKLKNLERFLVLLIVKKNVDESNQSIKEKLEKIDTDILKMEQDNMTPEQRIAELKKQKDELLKRLG